MILKHYIINSKQKIWLMTYYRQMLLTQNFVESITHVDKSQNNVFEKKLNL